MLRGSRDWLPHTREHWLLVAITACAGILRLAPLDRQSFSSDEAVTALLVRMGLEDMLRTIVETESTPPLYYMLAWGWSHVFGGGEVGLRSLSAAIGTATIPVVYAAGAKLVSAQVGLAAAAVASVSPLLVFYAQEARSYSLLVGLGGLSFVLFLRARSEPRSRSVAAWAVASALALATHYFAVFVIAPQAVWLLARRRTRAMWTWVGVLCVTGLALLPLAVEQRANGFAANLASGDPLSTRLVILVKQFVVGPETSYDRVAALLVGLLLLASIVVVLARGNRPTRIGAATAAGIGVCAIAFPVALALAGADYVITRNALGGFVPLAVAACAGVQAAPARTRWVAVGAACTFLLASTIAITFDPRYQRPDWRGFARTMAARDESRVIVVAPNLDGWSARIPLRIYLGAAVPVGRELLLQAPQFLPLVDGVDEVARPVAADVREIAVAGVQWERPLAPEDIPEPFVLTSERTDDRYSIAIYRAERPVVVDARSLGRAARGAAVLFQPRSDRPAP